jgi:hypothetical protein
LARYAQCDGQVITGGNISIAQVCVSFWLTAAAPKINGSNGRDHWPVGGAMMIGGGIAGGRVVGGTDSNLRAQSVNSITGEVTTASGDSTLATLNPTHLAGSVLSLCLGSNYLTYRDYLTGIEALTKLRT